MVIIVQNEINFFLRDLNNDFDVYHMVIEHGEMTETC